MLNTHKDWMAGKSATANNKDDLILLLEPAGSVNLQRISDEMKDEGTGLLRTVAQFAGIVDGDR